jgi:hypothetical protein
MSSNLIAQYETADGTVEIHGTNGGFSVFVGERMVQKDLNARDFACYMAHCLQAAHYKRPEVGTWISVETQQRPDEGTYLVANAKGQVAPWIRGVIHNNVGSAWDWEYGEAITHWMPLPQHPPQGER